MIEVKIINKSGSLQLPTLATSGSVGYDLHACFDGETDKIKAFNERGEEYSIKLNKTSYINLSPHSRILIPTGLYIQLPNGYEAQIRPRSGLALKSGITVLNTPGTIDSDYRGEIGVILFNTTSIPIAITHGMKIAQMVINKVEIAKFISTNELDETERNEGGFGHTGT